jgi:hypothetical protein
VKLEQGDYVKFEMKDDKSGEAEWMWLRVDSCDEPKQIVFGWLESQPVVFTTSLRLGQRLAVSYDNIRDHKKSNEFQTKPS